MARVANTGPMKDQAARQMRRTAAMLDQDHPETVAGDHLRDAAKMLDRGQLDSTKRHLDAAMEVLTPRNLYRHGITDDEGHATAKHHMHQVHRHRLAVQDIEDTRGSNDRLRALARARRGEAPAGDDEIAESRLVAAAGGGPAIQLAFNQAEPRGPGGRWTGRGSQPMFGAGTKPGSFEHIRAIEELGDQAGSVPGDPELSSPTMRTSLRHLARSVALRDMEGARAHLSSAKWANRHEAGGIWSRQLASLQQQLAQVPKQETGWQNPPGLPNPLMQRFQHSGKYVGGQGIPSNPTAHALRQFVTASMASPASGSVELAGPYRYRHGWVKLADAGPFSGRVVQAKGKDGRTVTGRYNHKAGTVAPRHGKPVQVTHVMGADERMPAAAPLRGLAKYRQAAAYGTASDQPGVELSARTPMLERTPAPRGRPGGPGLYDVKGMGHTPYLQQIVKALIEKRGMPPGKAYAIARGAIRKWLRGGGHVHPEVRAAAAGAEAGEIARQGRAKASHGHASGWDVADALVELACDGSNVIDLFNPNHAPTGQFTTASGAGAGQGKGSKAQQRARLTKQISSLRSRIRGLEAQLPRRTGSSSPRSKSSTPRKKGAGAQSARQAKAGKTAGGKAASGASSRTRSPSAIRAQITILRGQLRLDVAALKRLK